jgi:peptidoglycan/LPS O-acetylase OafA/YrhL
MRSRGRPLNAPAAFIHPCRPTVVAQPPSGPGWAHELKRDGYRLQIHERRDLPALTSLRFFAAMLVVLCHYDNFGGHNLPLEIAGFGYQAVTFFFVLSGFILAYAHATPVKVGLNIETKQFYVFRLARILPAYFIALAIAAPFYFQGRTSFAGTVSVLLLIQSWWPSFSFLWNNPAWSLSNEIFFYALFPILCPFIRKAPKTAVLTSFAAICGATLYGGGGSKLPWLNLPQFTLGIALAFCCGPRRDHVKLWSILFFVSLATAATFVAAKPHLAWIASTPILGSLFGFIIFAAAASPRGAASKFLSATPLVLLGEISYGIYIYHFPIFLFWNHATTIKGWIDLSAALDLSTYLVLVIAFSYFSYSVIEVPIRSFSKLLIKNPDLSTAKPSLSKAWLKIKNPNAPAATRAIDGTF